jgi:hypothetical protein
MIAKRVQPLLTLLLITSHPNISLIFSITRAFTLSTATSLPIRAAFPRAAALIHQIEAAAFVLVRARDDSVVGRRAVSAIQARVKTLLAVACACAVTSEETCPAD